MKTAIFCAALALTAPLQAGSKTVEAPGPVAESEQDSIWTRDRFTGDWAGFRTTLSDHGVIIDPWFTGYYQSLFHGAGDKDLEFTGRLDALIHLDTGKLGLWEGGGAHVHLEYRFGDGSYRNSPRSGGLWPLNTAAVLPVGDPAQFFATSIYYSQKIGDSFSFLIGKINAVDLLASDPFYGGWGTDRFENIAFVAPPSGVFPPVIFGAVVSYKIAPFTLTFMAYDPNDQTDSYWPEDFLTDGVNLSLAISWAGKIANRTSSLTLTGIYSTKEGADLGDILLPPGLKTDTKQGSYNVSLSFAHLIYESPDQPGKGFGIYGKLGLSDGNPNPIRSYFSGGFAGHRVIPGRPRDSFGIGYYYYDFSDVLEDAADPVLDIDSEQGFEVFYSCAVTPWLHLSADLQWVDPALGDNPQAWIGSLRAKVSF